MASEIRMPQLDADMQEADLLSWLVEPGAVVEAGEVLLELETDKATVEFEAPMAGTLVEILVPAGTAGVEVGTPLCTIEPAEASEATSPDTAKADRSAEAAAGQAAAPPARASTPTPAPAPAQTGSVTAQPGADAPDGHASAGDRIGATALARRLAEQAGLELDDVAGTGSRGRVTRRDVERQLREDDGASGPDSAQPAEPASADSAAAPAREATTIPHSRMRRTIAERLSTAKRTIPHFYLQADCAAERLAAARADINASMENGADGVVRISINDFVIRAAALALREVPEANASWTDDAVIRHASVDIAVAVATDAGLITPILREADRKGLAAISSEMRDLAERARTGKLAPREYQGGGFSISNLGMYGIGSVYPIINPPHACILGVGAAQSVPVVRDGAVVPGSVLSLTLSADHRVVDGAVGARLLAAIKQRVEEPLDLLL